MEQKPFHNILKYERACLSLSQAEFAEKVGSNLKTIRRWETGESFPQPLYRRRISELFGKSIEELGLLNGQREQTAIVAPVRNTQEDWDEAPRDGGVYGRDQEIEQLKQWIVKDGCRVVAVLGLGGIGKTTLTAHTAMQVKGEFDYVFWRSLQNAPLLSTILKQCIQFISAQQCSDLPPRIDGQLDVLIHYLQAHRCLVVLDNVESIMRSGPRPGHYREGYEDYGKLIKRVGEVAHQSCLLLTSREKPGEVSSLARRATHTRSLPLNGVQERAGQEILRDQRLSGSDEQWSKLITLYSGNPLALKLVSESIQGIFGGDIASFLHEDETIFGGINELLEQQFQRLSDQERELLTWLAIEREAVSLTTIREDLLYDGLSSGVVDTLDSLHRRFLIETREANHFTLQPVIMEYVTANLVRQAYDEFVAHANPAVWMHYALIKAQAKAYVRESQMRLLLVPIAQRLRIEIGEENIERTLKDWLEIRRRISSPQQRCYLAGNALNLLNYLQRDLRTIDFSRVMVRQAYLQEVSLHDVNFSHAHFAATSFANTFGNVLAISCSASKNLLAVGTATGEIWIYELLTGTPIFSFAGHTDGVYCVAFSPDERVLASSSDDRIIRLWDLTKGEDMGIVVEYTHRVRALAFSPDGRILASGSDDGKVCLWDMGSGECFKVLHAHSERIWSLAFSPDGILLASGSNDSTICLWDIATDTCKVVLHEHSGWIWSVAFNREGSMLASGSEDKTVRLWDVVSAECISVMKDHTYGVRAVAFNREGSMLASGSEDKTVRLWSVDDGHCVRILEGHTQGVRSLAFQPSGDLLISGGDDQTMRVWDSVAGNSLRTLQGYTRRVWLVAFSPDGQKLVSNGEDRHMRLWQLATGQQQKIAQDSAHGVRAMAFSPDGELLATGGEDQTVRLWSFAKERYVATFRGHKKWLRAVAFSPDGGMLASGGEDHEVMLWDISTGRGQVIPQGHESWVRAVAFSPDGSMLASGSDDQTIRIWDLRAKCGLHVLSNHDRSVRSLAFSPDGSVLASGSEDKTVRLWDVGTGQQRFILEGHTGWVRSVVFSPDGQTLASSSDDHTVRLWSMARLECVASIAAHSDRIRSIAFSPDGSLLVSGSDDGDIKLWDVQTGTYVKTLVNEKPYAGMNITGASGLTEAQKETLRALGAVEDR